MVPHTPVILAPRGEFSPGFLRLKKFRKAFYIALTSRLGLYDNLTWQASSEQEAQAIRDRWPREIDIRIAPDMPPMANNDNDADGAYQKIKHSGSVRFIFVSRIVPMKNLMWVLEHLQHLSGQIEFNIYGPISDEDYWRICQRLIARLPSNVKVTYGGILPHEQVKTVLRADHFFVLPTLGENFGHAIYEALAAGCPAVISDQTIWRDLTVRGAGWDIPLAEDGLWHDILQQCVDMSQEVYKSMSNNAQQYVQEWLPNSELLDANIQLLLRVL
jgi:glycosyltransferase involved in cell wall biosynthesis